MMTRFQIFLVVVFSLVSLVSLVTLIRGTSPKLSLLTFVLGLLACAAAIWPNATTDIAKMVGITRGADLILYIAILVMMAGFFLFYIRLRYLRRELTLMVRHVALMEAYERGDDDGKGVDRHSRAGTQS